MASVEEIQSFQDYAVRRIRTGAGPLEIDDLLLEWQSQKRDAEKYASDVTAIREALGDLEAGDRGESADEVIRALKAKYGSGS